MTNQEMFRNAYLICLGRAHALAPHRYSWPIDQLGTMVDRSMAALAQCAGPWDSPVVKEVCKMCKIKPTMRGIAQFLSEVSQ